jgi:drug/metabolite transporter (DMT)-like permease
VPPQADVLQPSNRSYVGLKLSNQKNRAGHWPLGRFAFHERIGDVLWLAGRRWWVLAGALVFLLLGWVRSISVLRLIPAVSVLLLFFLAMLMALIARRVTPERRSPK